MRLERGLEREIQLPQQRRVTADVLEHRIDEHGLAGASLAQQVRVGRRLRVEHLAEDQHRGHELLASGIVESVRAPRRSISSKAPMPSNIATTNTAAFA